MTMNQTTSPRKREASRAPAFVRLPGPLVNWMLRAGVGLGPNTLVTIRGRKSGQPRTLPIAIVEDRGRRWIVGAYGDVQWVRNLRAAGQASIQVDGQPLVVSARELGRDEAREYFRTVIPQYTATRLPKIGLQFLSVVFRLFGASDILGNPERAAERFPVFELRPLEVSPEPG
jgi:deazaflavin-dependent oxidoreductase (nitroreductase family)